MDPIIIGIILALALFGYGTTTGPKTNGGVTPPDVPGVNVPTASDEAELGVLLPGTIYVAGTDPDAQIKAIFALEESGRMGMWKWLAIQQSNVIFPTATATELAETPLVLMATAQDFVQGDNVPSAHFPPNELERLPTIVGELADIAGWA